MALGAGLLDLEKAVFDFAVLDKIAAVEWSDDNLEKLKTLDKVVPLKINLKKIKGVFPADSFDVVTLFDVVEHLPIYEAVEMIHEAGRISKKIVLCFVPIQSRFLTDIEGLEHIWGIEGAMICYKEKK